MNNYYFTFGQNHEPFSNFFVVIIAPTEEKAREKMQEIFGRRWAFCYTDKEWYDSDGHSQQMKWNLQRLGPITVE